MGHAKKSQSKRSRPPFSLLTKAGAVGGGAALPRGAVSRHSPLPAPCRPGPQAPFSFPFPFPFPFPEQHQHGINTVGLFFWADLKGTDLKPGEL